MSMGIIKENPSSCIHNPPPKKTKKKRTKKQKLGITKELKEGEKKKKTVPLARSKLPHPTYQNFKKRKRKMCLCLY